MKMLRSLAGFVVALMGLGIILLFVGGLLEWGFILRIPVVGEHPFGSALVLAVLASLLNRFTKKQVDS